MEISLFDDISEGLKENLSHERYVHTLGVAYTACALAMRYKYEPCERAFIAGLLHDCAKYQDMNKLFSECDDNLYILSEFDQKNPALIHAKLGPIVAQEKYGIFDWEIQDAIRNHTTGAPDMGMLSKFVFIADYIEPNRDGLLPHITKIQETAFRDLDLAILMILENTLEHLKESGKDIDPMTQKTYDFYKEIIDKRKDCQ